MPDITLESSDEEIDAFLARPRKSEDTEGVSHARYDVQTDTLVLVFPEGTEMRIPRRLLEGLADANPEDVVEIELAGLGELLWWPRLEVGHPVSDLVLGWYGSRSWCKRLGLHPKAA